MEDMCRYVDRDGVCAWWDRAVRAVEEYVTSILSFYGDKFGIPAVLERAFSGLVHHRRRRWFVIGLTSLFDL